MPPATASTFALMPPVVRLSEFDVHYVVVEAGEYDEPGYKMEAVKFTSTRTDENNSWVGESRSYLQSYSNPVVIGQVMTYNDPDWSVFWACGSSRSAPPTGSALKVGKHVGEDSDTTRADETIGYIVIETSTSGTAEIEGLRYVAALGGDSIKGVGDCPAYNYSYYGHAELQGGRRQPGRDGRRQRRLGGPVRQRSHHAHRQHAQAGHRRRPGQGLGAKAHQRAGGLLHHRSAGVRAFHQQCGCSSGNTDGR